jgi:hypothetical protein
MYVVHGNSDGVPSIGGPDQTSAIEEYVSLPSKGFRLFSRTDQWTSFQSATSGDFNGDGINDLLIGSPDFYLNNAQTIQEQRGAGAALTIYGKNGGVVNGYMNEQLEISYSNSDSSKGFKVYGAHAFDTLGSSLSSIGDFNGDGIDDMVIAASSSSRTNLTSSGEVYILFGAKEAREINVLDSYLQNSSKGFKIFGTTAQEQLGYSVSSAGDINGDGLNDILIATYQCDVYVIYGKTSDMSNINSIHAYLSDSRNGFSIHLSAQDCSGWLTVASAGDVNGDGADDIMIGAQYASTQGLSRNGAVYVIYGSLEAETQRRSNLPIGDRNSSGAMIAAFVIIFAIILLTVGFWKRQKMNRLTYSLPNDLISGSPETSPSAPDGIQLSNQARTKPFEKFSQQYDHIPGEEEPGESEKDVL